MNTPNVLTVARILLVPVMAVALLQRTDTGDVIGAGVFALASGTDFADGWLARRRGQVTAFGKLADPLADKLLVATAIVILVAHDRLAAWVAVVVLGREAVITVHRQIAAQQGDVIPAAWLGKAKTSLQVLVILLLVLVDPSPTWLDVLVIAMVVLTVVSGLDYARAQVRARRAAAGSGVPSDA